jgi:hypothetical protein
MPRTEEYKKYKKDYNFLNPRDEQQRDFWPDFCENWDKEQKGKRFRSEVLSLCDLWELYIGGADEKPLTEEQKERGEKERKLTKREKAAIGEVAPINARRIIAREIKVRDTDGSMVGSGEYEYNVHFHDKGYLHFDQWLYARDQARKDLYWLGREVFNCDFESHVHQPVCDQFVQKNFDGVFRQDYTLKDFQNAMKRQDRVPNVWLKTAEYERKTLGDFGRYVPDPIQARIQTNYAKTMILLDSRGFFKSTIDGIDTISWIINCPDIRILIMGGVYKLATQFLTGIKRRFYLPKGGRPTAFHLLFPEYVVRGVDGDSAQPLIVAPRVHESFDPTIGIISVGSNQAGFHCDIAKLDDVVTEENCNTEETRESLMEKADGAVNLVLPWGWIDIIGTRYFPKDYYGVTIDKHQESPEKFPLKFFQRACWVVKPEFFQVEKKGLKYLEEHMVILTFPEHADWKDLQGKLNQNEKKFRCQQLNQPVWGDSDTPNMPMALLMAHRVSMTYARGLKDLYLVAAIDTAREAKKSSDWTVIAVGGVYQKPNGMVSMVILDVRYGKWTQTEIANNIAKTNKDWSTPIGGIQRWVGEDSGVGELLKRKILDVSRETYGLWMNINWTTPSNNDQAKVSRIKGTEVLLRADRLDFVEAEWNVEAFEQFDAYKGKKSTKSKKDDIPDAISYLNQFLPSSVPLTPQEQEAKNMADELAFSAKLLKAHHDRIFSGDQSTSQYAFNMPTENSEPSSPMGGISNQIFGGNGMRA